MKVSRFSTHKVNWCIFKIGVSELGLWLIYMVMMWFTVIPYVTLKPDPPEGCHLNIKELPKA